MVADLPYRSASEPVAEASMLRCPACGGPASPDARACPHCSAELACVRCSHCYSLHFAGSRFCAHCARELELEPLLDATDAPCPRCQKPLSARTGASGSEAADVTYECVACGGIFLDNPTLDRVVADARAAAGGVHPVHGSHAPVPPGSQSHAPLEPVRYVKCPMCATAMNRVNFGRRSGVIVNVCKAHGTWFDAGELARAYDFAATGGIDEAERADRLRMADELRARDRAPTMSYPLGTLGGDGTPGLGTTLLRVLRDIVR